MRWQWGALVACPDTAPGPVPAAAVAEGPPLTIADPAGGTPIEARIVDVAAAGLPAAPGGRCHRPFDPRRLLRPPRRRVALRRLLPTALAALRA